MKVSDRLHLIEEISRTLQARYSYNEIDVYLAAFAIESPQNVSVNSKRVYSAAALKSIPTNTLLQIAEDLGLTGGQSGQIYQPPPSNWIEEKRFRLFISHISKDKRIAARLKDVLASKAISAFVAHEDISPTLEWQIEIERALVHMDAFLSIHTGGFSGSNWTQQEIGFALARGVKMLALRMGEDPTGFISRRQAISRLQKDASQVADEIELLLLKDDATADKLKAAQEVALENADEIPF